MSDKEIRKHVYSVDLISRLLIDAGIPTPEVANVFSYWELCGDENHYQDTFRLRPLSCVYLAVTNTSDTQITLKSIKGTVEHESTTNYRLFEMPKDQELESVNLPFAPIPPESTVIIPLATLLCPIEPITSPVWSCESTDLGPGVTQDYCHTAFDRSRNDINMIGPAIWPSEVLVELGGVVRQQLIHELDLSNLYAINRYWSMGCCPHLFYKNSQMRTIMFEQELFSSSHGKSITHEINIPAYVDELLIAELESEITHIEFIQIDGSVLKENITLRRGETFKLRVRPKSLLVIKGYYVPEEKVTDCISDPFKKNELIVNFLREESLR